MNRSDEPLKSITRRHFFRQCGIGVGTLALTALMNEELFAATLDGKPDPAHPLAPKPVHFPAKAKNVIFLFMAGAPSQIDLFDPKPKLVEHNGQPIPEEIVKGE